MRLSEIRASVITCFFCNKNFTVRGRARLSRDAIGFVKVGGNVKRCPRCHTTQNLTILMHLGEEKWQKPILIRLLTTRSVMKVLTAMIKTILEDLRSLVSRFTI